jgi:hypothetical protein
MLEVNITCLVADLEPSELSGSIAERGANAGPETWANSMGAAANLPDLLSPSEVERAKAFFEEFGAWSREEIAGWSAQETTALVLQYAAGDLREVQALCPGDGLAGVDWEAAERLSHEGTVSGRLWSQGEELWITLD